MATRELLSPSQRARFTEIPNTISTWDLARYYTLSIDDLKIINRRRRNHNRLGFAVQLCYLRFPGRPFKFGEQIPESVLSYIAKQLSVDPSAIAEYAREREPTKSEHLREITTAFGFRHFNISAYREMAKWLLPTALSTDKGIALVTALIEEMRARKIMIPALSTVERLAWEVRRRAQTLVFKQLTERLTDTQRHQLDELLVLKPNKQHTDLTWLRQPPGPPTPNNFSKVVERLEFIRSLRIDSNWKQQIHQNHLKQLSRTGAKYTPAHLARLNDLRRYATLVAFLLDTSDILVDQAIDMHDRMMGQLFSRSERQQSEQFQDNGKAINEKVRLYAQVGKALIVAKDSKTDAYEAIQSILPWEKFVSTVVEAEKLARPDNFDYLDLFENRYSQLRRYTPKLLETFEFKAASPSLPLLQALLILRELNISGRRNVPTSAPTNFIKPRWRNHVFNGERINRHYYEMCALSELRSALRSGDVWVVGSRQFKDFEEYLLPTPTWQTIQASANVPVAVDTNFQTYIEQRQQLMSEQLARIAKSIADKQLVDVRLENERFIITPLKNVVPEKVKELTRHIYNLLPRIKLTELIVEVDSWTGFSRHFNHARSGDEPREKIALFAAILADAINLGLSRMAEASPGMSFERLAWVSDWYIRDETYSLALAEVVNFHHQQPFSAYWGDGTTSSSDGQRFRAGGHREANEQVNLKYGLEPSVMFYTHISDQYAPFHIKVINATDRDATHILDGLLYHESDLQIQEHYTDTSGYTEHLFAICHLLGFRFAPRIRDLADKRLYIA